MRHTTVASVLALAMVLTAGAENALARDRSCWGQATAVFAQMGEMGEHASEQATPRLGLANLARELYDAGVLDEPTLSALGAFVADELGLTIQRCQSDRTAVAAAERAVSAQAACWG